MLVRNMIKVVNAFHPAGIEGTGLDPEGRASFDGDFKIPAFAGMTECCMLPES